MPRANWDWLLEQHQPFTRVDGQPGTHCKECSLRWPCLTAEMLMDWAEESQAAEAKAAALMEALRKVEWVAVSGYGPPYCPVCGRTATHLRDCAIGNALAALSS